MKRPLCAGCLFFLILVWLGLRWLGPPENPYGDHAGETVTITGVVEWKEEKNGKQLFYLKDVRFSDGRSQEKREYENEKGKCVTVEFDNYSDKDWKFSSSGYLAIEINDAYYSIPNDPCFDGYTIGTLSYNCSVIRHEITSEDYFLVPYGDLPPADYILLIPAQAGSDTCFVQVKYKVK